MIETMQAHIGQKITLELVNGRVMSGTLLSADKKNVRLEVEDGVGTIGLDAVQVIWECAAPQLFRDKFEAENICHGSQYTCRHSYYCSHHHGCTGHFHCRYEFSSVHKGMHHPQMPCSGWVSASY